MKRTIAALAMVISLAAVAVIQQFAFAKTPALPTEVAPQVGFLAPAFELEMLDGGTLGVSRGEREKPVILNFWASWCDPCREEAPLLADLYERYGDRLDIYGVNGIEFDNLNSVKAFVELYGHKFPILLDEKSKVYEAYQVLGYPTSVFIDRNGVIQDIVIGLPSHDEYEKKVKKLIR